MLVRALAPDLDLALARLEDGRVVDGEVASGGMLPS